MEQLVKNMHPIVSMSGGIELFAAAITLVLLIGFLCSGSRRTSLGKSLIAVLVFHVLMQATDACLWFLVDRPAYVPIVKVLNIISNMSWCLLMAAYTYCIVFYIAGRKPVSIKIAHAIAIFDVAAAIFYMVNYQGMFYYFDDAGIYCNGTYLWIFKWLWYGILCVNMLFIFCHRQYLKLTGTIGFLSYGIFLIVAFQLEKFWDVTPVYMASMISIIWVCILIYMNQSQELQKKEAELTQKKVAIMLSQIQPHFLYNALLVIQELCHTDPEEAEKATIEFSRFLRGNLDSLSADAPIPFEKEINHTKNYLALEQKRFGKKLRVEWQIDTTAFLIPALTLQPIVENAVRYGVTKRKGGGTVKIVSEEKKDHYEIVISDDGMGFDIHKTKEDGRTHIGVSNVANRLAELCGGSLNVESTENVGTKATIIIPKGET